MTSIDYAKLAAALEYYEQNGYDCIEVPWIVGQAAYYATKPAEALDFVTLGGYLAASAEQSYLDMMLSGTKLGQNVALTPCFRHEVYDDLHQPYFMKVELISANDTSDAALAAMIATASAFFERYVAVRVQPMPEGSFDIVDAKNGIELGSYGRRRYGDRVWLYGTGLAEPRLCTVLSRQSESRHQ